MIAGAKEGGRREELWPPELSVSILEDDALKQDKGGFAGMKAVRGTWAGMKHEERWLCRTRKRKAF